MKQDRDNAIRDKNDAEITNYYNTHRNANSFTDIGNDIYYGAKGLFTGDLADLRKKAADLDAQYLEAQQNLKNLQDAFSGKKQTTTSNKPIGSGDNPAIVSPDDKKKIQASKDLANQYKDQEDHLQKLFEIQIKLNDAQIKNTQYLMSQVKKGSEDQIKLIQQEIDLKQKRIALLAEEKKRESEVAQNQPETYSNNTSSSNVTSGNSTAAQIWSFFSQKGLNKQAVSGILGNLQQESSLDPNASGGGLAQWQGSRWNELVSYAKQRGLEANSLQAQMEFLWKEISGGSQGVTVNDLNSIGSASGVAQYFSNQFERPGTPMMNNRKKYASDFYSQFSADKSMNTYVKVADEAAMKTADFDDQIAKLKQEIANLNWDKVTAQLQGFEDASKQADQQISISKSVAEQYNQSSQQFRDETQKQIPLLVQKEDLAHKEADAIREAQKLYAKNSEQYAELDDKLKTVTVSYWDAYNAIHAVQQEIKDSKLSAFNQTISDLNTQLSQSKDTMSMMKNGSKEYENELVNQMSLESQIIDQQKQKEQELRSFISTLQVGTAAYENYTKQLNETISAEIQSEKALYDMKSSLADDIINIYKSTYEQEKTVALNSIQKQMDAEDKRHQQRTDNLDQEMQAFQDAIDAQTKAIDNQSAQDDYNQQLQQAQQDAQDTQNQINALSLDNSPEAQSKLLDLHKQYADKQQAIAKLQHDREVTLRKQNLQDQLDTYKKQIDAQKKAEDDMYSATKNSLDEQKTTTQQTYDDLINDERHFTQIREQIMSGHFDAVKSDLASFGVYLNNNMKTIGTSITQNLIDKIQQAMQLINQVQNMNVVAPTSSGSGHVINSNGNMNTPTQSGLNNTNIGSDGLTDYTRQARQDAINAGGVTGSNIPGFAVGGRVEKKTLAWVGEDEPETIIPDSFFKNQDGFTVGLNKIDMTKFDTSSILKNVNLVRNLPQISNIQSLLSSANINNNNKPQIINLNNQIQFNVKDAFDINKHGREISDYVNGRIVNGVKKLGGKW